MTRPILILLVLLTSFLTAQKKETSLTFSADQVYATSKAVTGDSAAWPLVVSLARRDVVRNGFTLDQTALKQLKDFSGVHAGVREGRKYFSRLLKAGARVFAADRMNEAGNLSSQYDRSIRDGDMRNAMETASRLLITIKEIENEIREKRTEDVDALLAERQGDVTKRKGLLGAWADARKGDMLKQSDGVKTGDASFAQLAFTDGCDVMIDPNSTVLIRESKMDKLDQTIRRDIALVRGGLLTTLTESAKERNNLSLQAGSSQSEVRSGKFWASAVEERRVKLSNYDGTMKVTANNAAVNLGANEGTVVEKGKPPLKPVQLLPPPQLNWERIDSTIYSPEIGLSWNSIKNSAEYRIEVSPSKDFTSAIKGFSTGSGSFRLQNIQLGVLFVRIYAVDKLGLRGMESPVYKIVRVEDKLPPPIYLNGWETERKYTILPTVSIEGTTEPDAELTADNVRQTVQADGSFRFPVSVGPSEKKIHLRSSDRSGNVRERILSIVPMDSNTVMSIAWNCAVENSVLSPTTAEISARGSSYPSIQITATLGDQTERVRTDSQGNWAIALRRMSGQTLTVVFESLSDHVIIGTKSLQVE